VSFGALATVRLWNHEVGVVAEDADTGEVVFEYAEAFRRSGLEISPLRLPLAVAGPRSFPELARTETFQGLPGVLADSLPDAFGNAIIRRWFEAQGTPHAAMSPVQRLLYLGSRAMGALEFHPAIAGSRTPATEEALELSSLVAEARRVVEGDPEVAVPEMMQIGSSAGGARAKALVLWNRDAARIRSGFAAPGAGDEPWLLKFDGVSAGGGGHSVAGEFSPGPWGRIEYVYARMARTAGIDVADVHLLREREFAHFMTRRFDRLHLHTLGGLLHADYNIRQLVSYEEWFQAIRSLGLAQPALDQAYLRMVFNIAARNQDDHVKNIAFLMRPDGSWSLAPAYDLTWAMGGRWTMNHQMTVRGKGDGFTRSDLLAVGNMFDVRRSGRDALTAVAAALATWRDEAREVGLAAPLISDIEATFRHFEAA
jgi:serine/threonine-protein kinase HipA